MVKEIIPIAFYRISDVRFDSTQIRIGSKISRPLSHFTNYYFPHELYPASDDPKKSQKVLLSIYPKLQRLITKNWFISLRSFSFQWRMDSGGDDKTLTTLAKIFEHTSQLPNLRIFAWRTDCNSQEPEEPESEEKSPFNPEDMQLPISQDLILQPSN